MDNIKRYEFTGELYQGARGGYYIDFPFDVRKEFGTKKQVKVKVWFDGHPERKSLLPKGDGTHWLSVAYEVRMAIGKSDGDRINVAVEEDLEPRTVDLPEDLEWLLEDDPVMKRIFLNQSYYTQKFFTDWIGQTRDPDIRVKRINRIFEWLQQHRNSTAASSFMKDEMIRE